jgi:hypothetical protein
MGSGTDANRGPPRLRKPVRGGFGNRFEPVAPLESQIRPEDLISAVIRAQKEMHGSNRPLR